jgi:nitrate reductase assembly molybdenum cofactor insertion protein NarJ
MIAGLCHIENDQSTRSHRPAVTIFFDLPYHILYQRLRKCTVSLAECVTGEQKRRGGEITHAKSLTLRLRFLSCYRSVMDEAAAKVRAHTNALTHRLPEEGNARAVTNELFVELAQEVSSVDVAELVCELVRAWPADADEHV